MEASSKLILKGFVNHPMSRQRILGTPQQQKTEIEQQLTLPLNSSETISTVKSIQRRCHVQHFLQSTLILTGFSPFVSAISHCGVICMNM
jgi:hypothetical protein